MTVAQTLFKKGASVEATFAFALAATNIVFELGILIYILLGGAYLGAELIAGVLLVVVMYLLVRATLPVGVFERARRLLASRDDGGGASGPAITAASPVCPHPGAHPTALERDGVVYRFCSPQCQAAFVRHAAGRGSVRAQLATLSGWYRISGRYLKTIGRIYKSVLGGFFVAGFIVLIPASALTTVFLPPTNPLAVVENAALGVLVGVFSFIGSIGIVPFAAALWFGGVGFAGVLGVIVADNHHHPGSRAVAQLFRYQGHRVHLRGVLLRDVRLQCGDLLPVRRGRDPAAPTQRCSAASGGSRSTSITRSI